MNRNVLLVYLRDLRDMEVAKYQINSILRKESNQYKAEVSKLQSEIASIKPSRLKDEPKLELWSGPAIFFLFLGVCFSLMAVLLVPVLSDTSQPEKVKGYIALLSCWGFLCLFFMFLCMIYNLSKSKQRVKAIREYNRQEQQRLSEVSTLVNSKNALIQSKTTAWKQRHSYLMGEYNRVGALLEKSYGLNIVPNQYRNLQSIYYIYDNMSTSQMSFDDTLFHEHMENGIQRILAKLDTIIAQNEEIIFQSRRIEANTREISENTLKILETAQKTLESQERTEQNTLEAAQNAQVTANYTEVNAFFSAASYLDSTRKS